MTMNSTVYMRRFAGVALTVLLFVLAGCDTAAPERNALVAAAGQRAPVVTNGCATGTQSSGALYELCAPAGALAGTLVVYAHGYVLPQLPLAIPAAEAGLPSVKAFVLGQGHGYAATSFHANGLVEPQRGVHDLRELVQLYTKAFGRPERVVLFGVSNGANLALLALEQNKGLYDGAFASCGPVGDFERQLGYFGDVFAAFDYFFPNVVPGGPDGISEAYLAALQQQSAASGVPARLILAGALQATLTAPANFPKTLQLLSVLANTPRIDADFNGPFEGISTVIQAVVYNVFATNNALGVLGGQFYENADVRYVGSADDAALNAGIQRYEADAQALAQVRAHYQTKGKVADPVVTLHNLRDPLVPFWQEALYGAKLGDDAGLRTLTPVNRFGHCNFTPAEIEAALDALVATTANV